MALHTLAGVTGREVAMYVWAGPSAISMGSGRGAESRPRFIASQEGYMAVCLSTERVPPPGHT
jgi:hypothetical protein